VVVDVLVGTVVVDVLVGTVVVDVLVGTVVVDVLVGTVVVVVVVVVGALHVGVPCVMPSAMFASTRPGTALLSPRPLSSTYI
jgi:hypothetical protein